MPHDSQELKRYGDEETALILRRAAELQEPRQRSGRATGFTLAEIQQIASEAGIDPARVAEAAALVTVHERDRRGRLIGAPTRFSYERVIAGEVRDPAWGVLVDEIREAIDKPGQVGHVAGALEWVYEGEGDWIRVGVTSRAGETQIHLRASRGAEASGVLSLSTITGMALAAVTAALLGFEAGPEFWAAIGGGTGGGAAFGVAAWKRLSSRWERRLSTLVTRLGQVAQEAAGLDQQQPETLPAPRTLGKEDRSGPPHT